MNEQFRFGDSSSNHQFSRAFVVSFMEGKSFFYFLLLVHRKTRPTRRVCSLAGQTCSLAGDALLIRGCGRTDFQQAKKSRLRTHEQWLKTRLVGLYARWAPDPVINGGTWGPYKWPYKWPYFTPISETITLLISGGSPCRAWNTTQFL